MDIQCTDKELFLFRKIAHAAADLQMPAYVVGGFVRDKLLRRNTKDVDIVCVGDGIALAQEVAGRFSPALPVSFFKNFGTAQIKWTEPIKKGSAAAPGVFEIEFVGARKESYQADSRNPSVEPGTLTDDQNRRDFSINALAVSLNPADFGQLLDPFQGLNDLALKIIRTPLDPDTTFSDDPLRMLRGIRFAAQLQFQIDEKTWEGIRRNKDRIKIISQERKTEDFNKILMTKKPSVGLDLLYRSGLMEIIFPQMIDLAGAEYIDGKGHKDNFYHTLQVVDNIAPHTKDLWLRWAALLHDIGKPATKKFEPGHGWTFHSHEYVGAKMVQRIFTKFKLPLTEPMRFVRKMVELHLRPISLTKENITDSAIRRLLFDAGDDIDALMTLCEADITSKNKMKVRRYLDNFELVRRRLREVEESDKIRNWQPPIDGAKIMEVFGLKPSQEVGILKTAIREAILDGHIENNYDAAYAFMLEAAKSLHLAPVQG
jgi:putative nucleotidyltransferase with HDIG domain